MIIKQYDNVILKNGKIATIVEKLSDNQFIADIGDSPDDWETIDLTIEEIEDVEYEVKEYCYDSLGRKLPVGPSFEDVPMGGHVISCPICRACLNQYINDEMKIKCKAIGDIPEELNERKSFRCDYFEPNQSSFDYDLVMRLMEENK